MTNSFDRDMRRGVDTRASWSSNPLYIMFIVAAVIIVGWAFFGFYGTMNHTQAPSMSTTTAPQTTEPATPPKKL